MKMRKPILLCLLLAAASSPAFADGLVCKAPGAKDVAIRYGAFTKFGKTFDCLDGDFVADLSGCAPDGAFALHAPTGTAEIVGVVDRWQDYAKHTGGIMSHFVTKEKVYFSGGFNGSGGYRESWSFQVNRITGKAQAVIDKKTTEYSCEILK